MTIATGLISAVFAQVFLAFALLVLLGWHRLSLVGEKKVKIADIALDDGNWPTNARKVSNAFNNQFQLPVLFYVAVGIALYLGAHPLDLVCAWSFVVTRYIHSGIHITTNRVTRRFLAYVSGMVLLSIWWIFLLIRFVQSALGA